jgi:hypothetical protein
MFFFLEKKEPKIQGERPTSIYPAKKLPRMAVRPLSPKAAAPLLTYAAVIKNSIQPTFYNADA